MRANPAMLADRLLTLVDRTRAKAHGDPFGNPVLSIAFDLMRQMETGELDDDGTLALIRHLRDQAFSDRAARLARYVGGVDMEANGLAFTEVARNVLFAAGAQQEPRWDDFRALVERTRYAAVFTGHPTFALSREAGLHLAEHACGAERAAFASHRPGPVTLADEFEQAAAAIGHGRDALDRFNAALLSIARDTWPERWTALVPKPLVLSTWVGYDTDGRTDIGWWDTLRLRLRMKRLQLARIRGQVEGIACARPLAERVETALAAVDEQIGVCPADADPLAVSRFAQALVGGRAAACVSSAPLLTLFGDAIAHAAGSDRLALCVARAGLAAHGLSLAHTHVRLNASQLHNAARHRLNIVDPVDAPARRRAMLAAINAALAEVAAVPVDFGALLAEQATAARMMMTVAQLVKHIDSSTPVRFLIAETESGYTLLAALWLARLFGVERHIEISPLFETEAALEHGAHVPGMWLDRALHTGDETVRDALLAVSATLDRLGASAALQAMFRRALADDLALRSAWPGRARMRARETLLHALRLALIQRIWLRATRIPAFAPRPGVTADGLQSAIVALDLPAVMQWLGEIFPEHADESASLDYAEPAGPRMPQAYAREHAGIFAPMARMYDCVREISTAITHEAGAFG
ncbi:hypothetical protein FAZ69_16960 [Trinickia terrae]|uniref:Phosphoenolpyruvate carboxylase n=1 Tax=Trinickia terrae TaxID=2571161 RepID=A0A4U1I3W8_9BURK|nr:hypothetical protein [Trinickia terrae]TKC87949.1 hypothetical protein FAZ69_16960 [Trinickia terrae]